MKKHGSGKLFWAFLVLVIFFACCTQASAKTDSPAASEDKTLSPYFFVKSEDPNVDRLPLKSTSALVNVSGVIADVTVTQVYRNEGKKTLEATYVFPASTRAAVYGMKMTIGERTITAQIQKREEARQAYRRAKEEGRSASLLEEHRPNVFQMNVANILPGDEIRTELRYTEILVPTDGTYEFVYPTVVGPRYSNKLASTAPPSEKWSQNPYFHEGEKPDYAFDIKLHMACGIPIDEMICSSHKVNIKYLDKTSADVDLDQSEKFAGNKDFILKYRLAGDAIQSGLLLYKGAKENFFLLMMQPPKRPAIDAIPPREYIFIVDVSGSMHGFPLEISKKLFMDLISGLRPSDKFNVLLFSGGSELFSERSVPAEPSNIQRAVQLIEQQSGGGGTELLPAIQRALQLPKMEGFSRTVVIATDGYVTVEPEIFDIIRMELGDANFFTFGIGTSVNRHVLEGMARVGAGEPFVISREAEAAPMAEKFRKYIQNPVLTHAKVDFGKFEAYDVEPARVPDLFAERPVTVFGKWKGKAEGTITLSGRSGKEDYSAKIEVSGLVPAKENSALKYLWARTRIRELADYNNLAQDGGRVEKITQLGLNYSLLTAYTSFVAIDTAIRAKGGDSETINQPLPLPEGVSDLAVGKSSGHYAAIAAPSAPVAPSPIEERPFLIHGSGAASAKSGRPGGRYSYDIAMSEPPATNRNPRAGTAGLDISSFTIKGALSENTVRGYVKAHLSDLLQCVKTEGTGGKILVKWSIDSDGTVKDIIIEPETVSWNVGECLKAEIAKWSFSAVPDGKKTHVTMQVSVSLR